MRADMINMIGNSEGGKTIIAYAIFDGVQCAAERDDQTKVLQQI